MLLNWDLSNSLVENFGLFVLIRQNLNFELEGGMYSYLYLLDQFHE